MPRNERHHARADSDHESGESGEARELLEEKPDDHRHGDRVPEHAEELVRHIEKIIRALRIAHDEGEADHQRADEERGEARNCHLPLLRRAGVHHPDVEVVGDDARYRVVESGERAHRG